MWQTQDNGEKSYGESWGLVTASVKGWPGKINLKKIFLNLFSCHGDMFPSYSIQDEIYLFLFQVK